MQNWPTTHTPQLKATFLELSKDWERLAIQLEEAFAQIDEINPTMLEAGWLSADPDTAAHTLPSLGVTSPPGLIDGTREGAESLSRHAQGFSGKIWLLCGTLPSVRGNVAVPGIRSPAVGPSRAMGTGRYVIGARPRSHCNESGTARPHRWRNEVKALVH